MTMNYAAYANVALGPYRRCEMCEVSWRGDEPCFNCEGDSPRSKPYDPVNGYARNPQPVQEDL